VPASPGIRWWEEKRRRLVCLKAFLPVQVLSGQKMATKNKTRPKFFWPGKAPWQDCRNRREFT